MVKLDTLLVSTTIPTTTNIFGGQWLWTYAYRPYSTMRKNGAVWELTRELLRARLDFVRKQALSRIATSSECSRD